MYRAIILPEALEDIREITGWYQSKKKGLGKRFLAQFRKKVRFLEKNPNVTPIRYDNVRTSVMGVFPFLIHYVIDEAQEKIIISAVFHTSRNPEDWEKRRGNQ